MSKECLKCGVVSEAPSDPTTCPQCRIVYEKYEASIAPAALKLGLSVEEYARGLRHAEAARRQRAREMQQEAEQRKAWEDKLSAQRVAEVAPETQKPLKVVAQDSKTATCRSCNGVVALGVKSCPHCGQPKPAPKPPVQVTKTHLLLAGIFVMSLVFVASSNQPRAVSSGLSAEQVVQRCAIETGIDPTSSRAVSMQDIRAIDVCVQKYGFRTSP